MICVNAPTSLTSQVEGSLCFDLLHDTVRWDVLYLPLKKNKSYYWIMGTVWYVHVVKMLLHVVVVVVVVVVVCVVIFVLLFVLK